jgi:hypothetical protein
MHRERIYISKKQSWDELNVGHYGANINYCYTNRRTAAPVRCVKDEQIGSITGSISVNASTLIAKEVIDIKYNAHSYGSAIENIVIQAEYKKYDNTPVQQTLREEHYSGVYNIEATVPFEVPEDCNEDGIIFRLIVRNEHGLAYADQTKLSKASVNAVFISWNAVNDSNINDTNTESVRVGQRIRYFAGMVSSSKPTSVTINGIKATEWTNYNVVPQPQGNGAFKTVWYVDWQPTAAGNVDMNANVEIEGITVERKVGTITVVE